MHEGNEHHWMKQRARISWQWAVQ